MPQPTPKKSYVVEGDVENVVHHAGNRYGIAVDGQWYNGFGPAPCAQFDVVSVSYEKVMKGDQEYRNVKQCTILEASKPVVAAAAPSADEPAATRSECINRAVALKAAVEFALGFAKSEDGADVNLKFTLAVARRFERWLNCEDESNVLS